MALSRNYVADLNDPGTRSRWERSTRRSGQDPTKNPYYRAALDGTTVAPLKTGSPMAKPLMVSDSMAKPMQIAPEPVGKPDQSGAQMLPEPTGMTVPSPMPQQGGAGWNDISRYQRTSGAGDSGRGGMPGPSIGNPRGIVNRLSPGGPETVGGALVGRALGNSRNNQRYAQAAASSRQANAQQNQIQQLTANGRTYDQALDELGLRGNPQWDASARVSRPRQGPRELPGGGDRYGRYQP